MTLHNGEKHADFPVFSLRYSADTAFNTQLKFNLRDAASEIRDGEERTYSDQAEYTEYTVYRYLIRAKAVILEGSL